MCSTSVNDRCRRSLKLTLCGVANRFPASMLVPCVSRLVLLELCM